MARYVRVKVKSALQRSGLPDLDYALNPYAGCIHGCLYCYAPLYTRYRDAAENWGQVVYIKENLVEVLVREVRSRRRGVVGVATITDPYQPVEREERLTRRAVDVLLRHGFHVSIQTKSDLVLRDLDLAVAHRGRVDVGLTVTTLDADTARLIEPAAPPPARRLRALREYSEAGVETWVFLGPVIPGINDDPESLEGVVEAAAEMGALLIYDYLRLKPGIAERLAAAGVSEETLRTASSRRWRRRVEETIRRLCVKHRALCSPAFQPKRVGRDLTSFLSGG